jgi:hypothetical protein
MVNNKPHDSHYVVMLVLLFAIALSPANAADEEGVAATVHVRHYSTDPFIVSYSTVGTTQYLTFLGGTATGVFERDTTDPAPTVTLSQDGTYNVLTYANAEGSCCGYAIAWHSSWHASYLMCQPACDDCGCFYGRCEECTPAQEEVALEQITIGPQF